MENSSFPNMNPYNLHNKPNNVANARQAFPHLHKNNPWANFGQANRADPSHNMTEETQKDANLPLNQQPVEEITPLRDIQAEEINIQPTLPCKPPAPEVPESPGTVSICYNIPTAFISCMKRYAMFDGRACRSEFWFFCFCGLIANLIPYVNCVWLLGALLPSIAVSIRRMHDIGKCGWYGFIPIYSFILACKPSTGPNMYGEAPLPPAK